MLALDAFPRCRRGCQSVHGASAGQRANKRSLASRDQQSGDRRRPALQPGQAGRSEKTGPSREMDLPPALRELDRLSVWDARRVQTLLGTPARIAFAALVDAMGQGSAVAQALYSPITTYERLLQHGDQVCRCYRIADPTVHAARCCRCHCRPHSARCRRHRCSCPPPEEHDVRQLSPLLSRVQPRVRATAAARVGGRRGD